MLPCPVRPRRSNRLATSMTFAFFFPPPPFNQLKRPTTILPAPRSRCCVSMLAVVDNPRDFGAQILAMNDAIDKPVPQEELARLEPLRQFEANRVLDRALTRESDHRLGLGQRQVALQSKTCGDAAHGRISEYRDVEP